MRRDERRRVGIAAVSLAVAVLAAGCSDGEQAPPAPPTPSSPAPVPSASAPAPSPSDPSTPPASTPPPPEVSEPGSSSPPVPGTPAPGAPAPDAPEPTDEAGGCDADLRSELTGVVEAQLDFFAQRDFAAALALTSEGFREEFDEARFEEVITGSFPQVLDADATALRCVVAGDAAQLEVRIEPAEGPATTLVYTLVREGVSWLIAGAAPADRPDEGITA